MRRTPATQPGTIQRVASATATLAVVAMACAEPAWAQLPVPSTPTTVTTDLIEWDITSLGDVTPGSLAVDSKSHNDSRVWFVTRANEPRLYRLTPGRNMKKDHAAAKSWALAAELTGGVRLRHSDDGRFAFINVNKAAITGTPTTPASGALVAIDTKDDSRITWTDRPPFLTISDVSVDTRSGGTTVFTAAPYYDAADFPGAPDGVVQRLRPLNPEFRNGSWVVPAEVVRYPVGGGAGTCEDFTFSVASPCIPGVAVDRRRGHPIYVSEPQFVFANGSVGAIGEIDPRGVKCPSDPYKTCVKVRHWPLPAGIGAPRQIRVDDLGRVWGITSTGHLFSVEIDRSYDKAKVTKHDPLGFDEYLFAVTPDGGIIGFTDTNNNKVSALFPQKAPQPVSPAITYVKPLSKVIYGQRICIGPEYHDVAPATTEALGAKYTNPGDGTYVETDVSTGVIRSNASAPSMFPTGIESDGKWKTGAFFYGVAFSDGSNRIGHLALRINRHEDAECKRGDHDVDHDGIDDEDDNDIDGDGVANAFDPDDDNDGILDHLDQDKNEDGIEDEHQSRGHREHKRSDKGRMEAGETREYEMTYDAQSVALIAIVEAAELTAPLVVEIVDDAGTILLTAPAVLGKAIVTATPSAAGVYTVRIKNTGSGAVNYKTTVLGKQLALY
jgi:hypothetical protein